MKMLRTLTKFELSLWLGSCAVILLAFAAVPGQGLLTLAASLVGVTSLIFTARGFVIGQILMLVFSALYGLISWQQRYYGEMLTYLGMTAPMAALAAWEWMRNPYQGSREVAVSPLTGRQILTVALGTAAVTWIFCRLLAWLDTANLFWSTVSIATSFAAAALTALRSPWYAVCYAANDLVLIVLWVLAAGQDITCLPVAVCFVLFFFSDSYGFFQWRAMARRQRRF